MDSEALRVVVGNILQIITKATMPRGRKIQKIHFQSIWSIMKPPKVGPMTLENPNIAIIIPVHLARSLGANKSPTAVTVADIRIPPPIP
ncbi:hypothetical protein D3C81_2067180 [compost metagenome]